MQIAKPPSSCLRHLRSSVIELEGLESSVCCFLLVPDQEYFMRLTRRMYNKTTLYLFECPSVYSHDKSMLHERAGMQSSAYGLYFPYLLLQTVILSSDVKCSRLFSKIHGVMLITLCEWCGGNYVFAAAIRVRGCAPILSGQSEQASVRCSANSTELATVRGLAVQLPVSYTELNPFAARLYRMPRICSYCCAGAANAQNICARGMDVKVVHI